MTKPKRPLLYVVLYLTSLSMMIFGAIMSFWEDTRPVGIDVVALGVLFLILLRQEPMEQRDD